MSEKIVKVGLLGLGTVGTGVVKIISKYSNIEIVNVAVKDLNKKRDVELSNNIITTDVMAVAKNPDIDVLIEVIGGIGIAYDAIVAAIKNGKHIVTANKELISKKGSEIFELANKYNVSVLYEGSVAGGIPIIMPIKQSLAANKIEKIAGILNGTTNYILSKMEAEKAEFKDVLAEAQQLGYAEADPTDDVEGNDAAYKLSIISSLAFGKRIDIAKIYREGISNISTVDIDYALELGYKIKLIAMGKLVEGGRLDLRVHPTFVSKKHPLAHINGVTNAISVVGDAVGEVNFSGPGAGEMPTASSVVADLISIVKEIGHTDYILPSMRCSNTEDADIMPIEETVNSYYVRLNSKDMPGVIGKIGNACGNHGVSLASVIQKDYLNGDVARIILLTHEVKESAIRAALKEIEQQQATKCIANVIRVL